MLKEHQAIVSTFEWVYDFAKARNFNFSQVPKEYDYILWLDADDVVKNGHRLEVLMRNMYKQNKAADMIVMDYLYDFDENKICTVKHLKTRIVRNDNCVEWVGSVHEDFKQLRSVASLYCKDIEICHLTNKERAKNAAERNLEIARKYQEVNPKDPRSLFLVANAMWGKGQYKESVPIYVKFIEESGSDEEIFIAYLRLAEVYRHIQDHERSLWACLEAIKLRPWYPAGYLGIAETYYQMQQFNHAEIMFLTGLRMAAEDKRYERTMVVWNPRDFDVNPLRLLTYTYLQLFKPREALQCLQTILTIIPESPNDKQMMKVIKGMVKELDKVEKVLKKSEGITDKKKLAKLIDSLPADLKSHPAIAHLKNTNFIKQESSGRDISIFCALTDEIWTPDTAKTQGIGGSEEAIIYLAPRLKKLGWNVTVYANVGHKPLEFEGVAWLPWYTWNYRNKEDVTIVWRAPKSVDFNINSDVVVLDLHDVLDYPYEFNKTRQRKIDKIFVKTKAHKYIIQKKSMEPIPDDKFVIIPNGLDVDAFNQLETRDPYYLLNTSSANRGLDVLLDLYEEALARVPEDIRKKVKLGWFYGWTVFDNTHKKNKELMKWKQQVVDKFEKLRVQGFVEGGVRLSHPEINKKYLTSGALVYPTRFYEIHCISAAKAQAAGCVPITTNFAALDETVKFGYKIDAREPVDLLGENMGIENQDARKEWVDALVDYLTNPHKFDRSAMAAWAKNQYSWDKVAQSWSDELEKLLVKKKQGQGV
jgi:glycosyltransferase involved in cell wall biosynthesis